MLAVRSLQTRSPKIAAFLANVSFDPAALNELILKIQKNHEPADAAAREWVATHRSTVDAWLAGDAKISKTQ